MAVVQGGLEGVIPLESLLSLTSSLHMHSLVSAVLVQLTERTGLSALHSTHECGF